MSTTFFTPPPTPPPPPPTSTTAYHRSITQSIFTRLDMISQQQTRDQLKETDDVEEERSEGGRRKSIYLERDRVGVNGSGGGFGCVRSEGVDDRNRDDQEHEDDEEDEDEDEDEEDEPDFYSLPLIPIGHIGSSFSSTQGPLVSSYISSPDARQTVNPSVPSSRGRSGRGRTRYSSLPAGSLRSMDRMVPLGTVIEDEEEDEVDKDVIHELSTPVRTSSRTPSLTSHSAPPTSTSSAFTFTPPRTPNPVRIAPASGRDKINRPLTSSRSHEYIKMFPITSRPKSRVVSGNAADGGVSVNKPAGAMRARASVGGSKGHAEALKLERCEETARSGSYLNSTPLKAEKAPIGPVADEEMMTPSVCLIPPEEDGNVSVVLHPSEPTRLPRRESNNDLASLILKNPFSFEQLGPASPPPADRGRSQSRKFGREEDDLTIELGRGLPGVSQVGRRNFFSLGDGDSDSEEDEDEEQATMLIGKVDTSKPDAVDTFTLPIVYSQIRTNRRVSLTLSTARKDPLVVTPESTSRQADEAEASPTSISSSTSTAIVASAIIRPSGPGMWRQSYGADSTDSDEIAATVRSGAIEVTTSDVGLIRHDEDNASRTSDHVSGGPMRSNREGIPETVNVPERPGDLAAIDAKVTHPEAAVPSYRRISCTFDLPPPVFSRRGTLRMDPSPGKGDGSPTRQESIVVMPRRKEDVLARMRSLRGEQPAHDMARSEGFQANVTVLERKLVDSAQPSNIHLYRQEENRSTGQRRNVSSSATNKAPRIGLRDVFGGQNNVSIDDRKEGPSNHPRKANEPDERRSTIIAPPRKPSTKRSLPSLRSAAITQTPKSLSQKFSFSSLSRAFRWGRGSISDPATLDREDVTSTIATAARCNDGKDQTFQSISDAFASPTSTIDDFGRTRRTSSSTITPASPSPVMSEGPARRLTFKRSMPLSLGQPIEGDMDKAEK